MSLQYAFWVNGHEGCVGGGELRILILFLGVLEHVDVLGDALCVNIIRENIGGEVDYVERLEAYAMQLEVVHERLGGNVGIYVLVVT